MLLKTRYERKMLRSKLAALAGVSEMLIEHYEHGTYVPSRKTLLRLAGALGVPPADAVLLTAPITERRACLADYGVTRV